MEFRHLGNGQYFPPIAPNGRVCDSSSLLLYFALNQGFAQNFSNVAFG